MIKYQVDVLVLTETWPPDDDNDNSWVGSTELNREPYLMQSSPRLNGTGGGIALVCKSSLKPKIIHQANLRSFEHATWSLINGKNTIHVTGVYYPPP